MGVGPQKHLDIIGKYPGPEGQALGYPWKGMFY